MGDVRVRRPVDAAVRSYYTLEHELLASCWWDPQHSTITTNQLHMCHKFDLIRLQMINIGIGSIEVSTLIFDISLCCVQVKMSLGHGVKTLSAYGKAQNVPRFAGVARAAMSILPTPTSSLTLPLASCCWVRLMPFHSWKFMVGVSISMP